MALHVGGKSHFCYTFPKTHDFCKCHATQNHWHSLHSFCSFLFIFSSRKINFFPQQIENEACDICYQKWRDSPCTLAVLLVTHFCFCIKTTVRFSYYFEQTWTFQTGLISCMAYAAVIKNWIFGQSLTTNQEGKLLPNKCHYNVRFHIIKFSKA